jgi:hypothetical protein
LGKCIPANSGESIGQVNIRQLITPIKYLVIDGKKAGRKDHFLQLLASIEQFIA